MDTLGASSVSTADASSFDAASGSNKSRNLREDGPRKRKGKHEALMEEWDELAREERLYKKLRKGKISQKQYDLGIKGRSPNSDSGDEEDGADSGTEEGGSFDSECEEGG